MATPLELVAQLEAVLGQLRAALDVPIPSPQKPTATLSASPVAVQAGQSVTLAWVTAGAVNVTLEGILVPSSGNRTLVPTGTATYTLVATNPAGSTTATVQVTVSAIVTPPPPPPTPGPGALLDNFDTLRPSLGHATRKLWEPYTGEGNTSRVSVSGGKLVVTVGSGGSGGYWHFNPNGDNNPNDASYPANAMSSFIESGTFDPLTNRFSFWLKSSKSSNGGTSMRWELGSYIIKGNGELGHYYHQVAPRIVAGQWSYWELNGVPQHVQGGATGLSEIPNYWKLMNRLYWNQYSHEHDGATIEIMEPRLWREAGMSAIDPLVSSIIVTYDSTVGKYALHFQGPARAQSYQVRYSPTPFAGDFTKGTAGAGVATTGNTYMGVNWLSPAVAQAPVMYLAIQPAGQTAFKEVTFQAR